MLLRRRGASCGGNGRYPPRVVFDEWRRPFLLPVFTTPDEKWAGNGRLCKFLDKNLSLIIIYSMITTVTGKNQITIPAKIAKKLDIQPGTRLNWTIGEDDTLIVRLLPRRGQLARKAAGMGQKWLSAGSDPVADLVRERAEDDQDEG